MNTISALTNARQAGLIQSCVKPQHSQTGLLLHQKNVSEFNPPGYLVAAPTPARGRPAFGTAYLPLSMSSFSLTFRASTSASAFLSFA